MATTIKVRRAGISRRRKKVPFRAWLDSLPRKWLTYSPITKRYQEGEGWTTEDFVLEANHRGLNVRIMTAYKWCSGTVPRWMTHATLERIFKKEKIIFE